MTYYTQTLQETVTFPPLKENSEADIAILGGGFAGLSAAIECADRGYSVILLEAEHVGWGASGRNGGQICSGYGADMKDIQSWIGREEAKKLWTINEEAKSLIQKRLQRFQISCGYAKGNFIAATKSRHMKDLETMAQSWVHEYGYDAIHMVPRQDVGRHVFTDRYVGGLHDPEAAHLNPLQYCVGLARAAASLGIKIFEKSAVTKIDPGSLRAGTAPCLHTAQGSVKARAVLLCGNAHLGRLHPYLRSKIMPVGTYVAATEPLTEEQARTLLPQNDAVNDCRYVLDYYRLSEDNRLIFGGGVSYSTQAPSNIARSMKRCMLRVFPHLKEIRMENAWGGYVAITQERMPHLGRLPGDAGSVYFAHGFSGHGVALTGIAGQILAQALSGELERLDLFSKVPITPFPGGPLLRMPALVLGGLYYRLRDLL